MTVTVKLQTKHFLSFPYNARYSAFNLQYPPYRYQAKALFPRFPFPCSSTMSNSNSLYSYTIHLPQFQFPFRIPTPTPTEKGIPGKNRQISQAISRLTGNRDGEWIMQAGFYRYTRGTSIGHVYLYVIFSGFF
jgi:hypothetical protein